MKQVLILVITLAIIIGAGLWEINYLKESSRYLLSDIKNIYQIVERDEYDVAKKEAAKLKDTWEEIRKTWALFIDDSKMDEVGDKLISFVSYIDINDHQEITHSYNCLFNSIQEIVEFECLKAENVF